ncbi:RNA-guided endonuclease IscB [Peptococcus simiae]|uniref:RNA-guided endonuclease IscB n=1 Tax=Peptococcus simiae TaxID=1643805 RepID=UPI00398189F0
MVYVLNIHNKPLMPTIRFGKVRRLLRDNKAKVVKRCPFTIKLLYEVEDKTQEITLGVDAGSKTIGLSATTKDKELFSAEYELRNDIVKKLSARRECRRTRRNRLRYRKPRFNNRTSTKKKGWLAPSIRHKIDSHLNIVRDIHNLLPITNIIVEVASFDIQKIKNPDIQGKDYQQGEQLGFWNVREYVLFRDGHICQHCKGKSKDPILNVHHIESRQTGGDSPSNLITLCKTCHSDYHKGTLELNIKRGKSFRDAAFMGIMRWTFYNRLREDYPSLSLTYGYLTKNKRIKNNLPKEKRTGAYCIANNLHAKRLEHYFHYKKVRCHNRQIHKRNIQKGGKLRNNQAPYVVKGFRLFDKVKYQGKSYFIFGRRQTGAFDIRDLKGNKVNKGSISYKKLEFVEARKTTLTERM